MARLNRSNLDFYVDRLNAVLTGRNAGYNIKVEGRNGNVCLDLIKTEDGSCIDTMFVGTLRECYDVVRFAGNVGSYIPVV